MGKTNADVSKWTDRFSWWAVPFLILAAIRFVGLDWSPLGLYSDESAAVTNMICLKETGRDASGKSWPLFSSQDQSDGLYSAPYLALGILWTSLWGTSPYSLRAFANVFILAGIVCLMLLAGHLFGSNAGWFSGLIALLSPWSFHMGRLVTDVSISPLFVFAGFYFLICFYNFWTAVLSGLLLGLTLYLYPPHQLVVPGVLLVIFAFSWSQIKTHWQRFITFLTIFFLSALPLVYAVLSGTNTGRFRNLSIFSREAGSFNALKIFFKNLFSHFDPSYLLWKGDTVQRFSTQMVGQWSWLDGATLFFVFLFWRRNRRVFLFLFFCYLVAILPSSLTVGAPHSFRSWMCWAIMAIAGGLVWATAYEHYRRRIATIFVLLTVTFSLYFYKEFFMNFSAGRTHMVHGFQTPVLLAAQETTATQNWKAFVDRFPDYRQDALRYYLIHFGKMSCKESASFSNR